MADELKRELGADCELVASGGGVFEIDVDGDPIFSKRSTGRFPNDSEVLDLIRARPA